MAALNFPASPSLNDTYSNGTQTWIWNGTMWKTGGQIGPTGPQGPAGSAGNDLPKITAVTYTDSSYNSNSATSVLPAGGYVKLTGSNFQSGCTVTVGSVAATATYVSSTQVNVAVAANTAGTYHLYLVNPDGGSTLRVNGVKYQ
jgi:IPT/TIG domain